MSNARFWATSLGFSTAIALALTFVALGAPTPASVVLGIPTAASMPSVLAIALTYAFAIGGPSTLLLPRAIKALRKAHPGYRTAVTLLAPTLISVPCTLLGTGSLVLFGLIPAAELWTRWLVDVRISVVISLTIGVASVGFARLSGKLQQTQLALKTQELARERAEKLASEARFASLSSRLQPHFLFNTLNSISSLIRTDPLRAERLLGRFAALLRSSLDAQTGELVSLRKEMKLVADYLEIQHVRFGQRLRYELDVPDSLKDMRVPPFAIQTLVENSVKFAVAPSLQGSLIRCRASTRDARLQLEVWDEGPGFGPGQIPPQHGIANLRERLQAIYGTAARLVIARERSFSPERTRVALELPLDTEVGA